MSFRLTCPNCGRRNVSEFAFRGELLQRPSPEAPFADWAQYVFFRDNKIGKQTEWWYHRDGCQRWFLVERDTTNNLDHRSFWYTPKPSGETTQIEKDKVPSAPEVDV